MLVLYETPAGFALFKVLKESKLDAPEELYKEFETSAAARKLVKLEAFKKFENTAEAVEAASSIIEGRLGKDLKKFLKKQMSKHADEKLIVSDSKLAGSIAKKLGLQVVTDAATQELIRGIRTQLVDLVEGIDESDINAMALGLSHSLSRFKLRFSPDKVDTMVIQAIGLLDDLDKELNTYSMRLKEWYGWHFPELAKIVIDNAAYARAIKTIGFRQNTATANLASVLPEELVQEVRAAAELSMGTEISDMDLLNITSLADQVISISEYRGELYEYLKNRMLAIAPNLTAMVGELVGARLVAHAGSLMNLAKSPASTIQILGAEKALFRALKNKQDTPKYGLIYHASIVGQAAPKLKGKISRVLAAKTALSVRADALGGLGVETAAPKTVVDSDGEETEKTISPTVTVPMIGHECRMKVEERLRQLEGQVKSRLSGTGKASKPQQQSFKGSFEKRPAAPTYNPSDDFTGLPSKKKHKSK